LSVSVKLGHVVVFLAALALLGLYTVSDQLARDEGCYKVILDCSEANAAFYERCGFSRKELQLALYL
jgi:hypothetical protein